MKKKTLLPTLSLVLMLLGGATLPAVATNRQVNNLNDSGAFSLRYWIANAVPGDTIVFSNGLTGTIVLTSGELVVAQDVTISNASTASLAISGNNSSRVFNIQPGITANIAGLTIVNGKSAGTNGFNTGCNGSTPVPPTAGDSAIGGAVLNLGYGTFSNCVLTANSVVGGTGGSGYAYACGGPNTRSYAGEMGGSAQGGAIFNGGTLRLTGCTLMANSAIGGNGGSGGDYNLSGTNGPSGWWGGSGNGGTGGGIYSTGYVTVVNCTFTGNHATGGSGGAGGRADGSSGSHGGSGGSGGSGNGAAMAIISGSGLVITSGTISSNSASGGSGGAGGFGGSNGSNGSSGSSGLSIGGGIQNAASIMIQNTIIAGNTGSSPDVSGSFSSAGFNFIGITNGSIGWNAGDIKGSAVSPRDPLLGPLQDNGGPTPTMALLPGSVAIDYGRSYGSTTDQRGFIRPVDLPDATYPNAVGGDGADIGAYEVQPPSLAATTLAATAVNTNSATLNGAVNPNGTTAFAWFQWGTSTSYGNSTTRTNAGSGSSAVPWGAVVTGLVPGTLYHFRAAATNSVGTNYGSDSTFTTSNLPPTVVTLAADLVTGTSGRLNGTVNPNSTATGVWFQWGTNTSYGSNTVSVAAGFGSSPISTNAILTGLASGVTYHYRVVARNDVGTNYGSDVTFSTATPPTVTTYAADLLTGNSARLNGNVNPNGTPTTMWIEWGTTASYGNTTAAGDIGQGNSPAGVFYPLSGLGAGLTYHYRVAARNVAGTNYGSDVAFTTLLPPVVATSPATLVTSSNATLNGTVNPKGAATTAWFEYGPTVSYGSSTVATSAGSGSSAVVVNAAVTSLAPGATYHFRVAANNGGGTSYGSDATFVTSNGPAVVWRLANSGAGSLRDALTLGSGNPVVFSNGLTGTILLTNGEVLVNRPVTILGPGASVLTVSGNNSNRVFNIASGVTATISGLTIANGRSAGTNFTGAPGWGGGILNYGSLTLSNCLLSGNMAAGTIGFTGNAGSGGAGGPAGAGMGGGIFNGSNLFLYGCTFRTNAAKGGIGGWGASKPYSGTGVIGNGAIGGDGSGGGLCSPGAVQIVNCTFWGNTAGGGTGGDGGGDNSFSCLPPGNGGPGGNGFGGAVETLGACTLTNCTFSSNAVSGAVGGNGGVSWDEGGGACGAGTNGAAGLAYGGGLHAATNLGVLLNTLIAGNTGSTNSPDVSGAITSRGHNLIGATNGSSGWLASDVKGTVATPTNALLGPLQDNGGPTPTLALLTGSRAIDGGDDTVTSALTTDQRGLLRLFGAHVDIGAYEAQVARPTLTVRRAGSKVVLSWPSPSTGFLLLQSPGMNPPNWTTNNTTPSDNGTTRSITNNSPTGVQFYRLKQ